jgi:glycosyltransferase involved in cell wall biosynthesis
LEVELKICLLTRFFDMRNAGLGRVSSEIRKGLVERGHEVKTVSTNRDSLYSYFFYTAGGILTQIPRGYDVYHALTPMEGLWIPKGRGVVTFHDLFQITDQDKLGSGLGYSKWKNLVGRGWFRFVANRAKSSRGIVAVSEKTKRDLIRYLSIPEKKIKVIRSGIPNNLIPQPKIGNKFRVGYLGQLDRRKRVPILIEAFKRSRLDELVIGGVGMDRGILEAQVEGDSRIKFLGLVPDEGLVDFYNSLDVFVFPTWLEGYGLPIVEAMACKKPVIVLDDAKIPWEIKRRCIIVQGLNNVLGNQNYLENLCRYVNIEDNYRWAREEHNWGRCIDEYIELYKEVLGEQ